MSNKKAFSEKTGRLGYPNNPNVEAQAAMLWENAAQDNMYNTTYSQFLTKLTLDIGANRYEGLWNANTNNPVITSSSGEKGQYYIVDTAGTTDIDGITDWEIGDWIIFNGSQWEKLDNSSLFIYDGTDVKLVSPQDINLQTKGLKDENVTTAIKLGDVSNTILNTNNQTLIGSINEVLASLLERTSLQKDGITYLSLKEQRDLYFTPDISVFADGQPANYDPNKQKGFYYKQLATPENPLGDTKINWYFYADTNPYGSGIPIQDLNYVFANLHIYNSISKPWITVYTKPQGDGQDASWYRSKYNFNTPAEQINSNESVLIYANDEPFVDIVQKNKLTQGGGEGLQQDGEEIMYITLQSNSIAGEGECEFLLKEFGFSLGGNQTIYDLKVDSEIINNLTSTDTNKPLSAYQGKVLFDTQNILLDKQNRYQVYYAKASENITAGQVVQFTGQQGDHITVKVAVPSEIQANPKLLMGLADSDILNGEFGFITAFGEVAMSTNGFALNDWLYFDNSTGQLTNVEPTAPNRKILIGRVQKEETSPSSGDGIIRTRITFNSKILELDDVESTEPTVSGQLLTWDNVNKRFISNYNITDYVLSSSINQANGVCGLDANGLVDISRIPAGAVPVLKIVADEVTRFSLTKNDIQNGDTVKQLDTNLMYYVKDDENLNNASGYELYSAESNWSLIANKPVNITQIADINANSDDFIQNKNGSFVNRNIAQVQADLNLPSNTVSELAGKQPAGTYNAVIGTDIDINTSGSTIIDNLYFTDGVCTSHGTRTIDADDVGALSTSGGTVSGRITFNSSYTSDLMLWNKGRSAFGGSSYSNVLATFRSGSVPEIYDNNSGDYFIYCATSSGTRRHSLSCSGVAYSSSDERLKENINTVKGVLDKIDNFRGVSFEWKEDKADKLCYGVIAQELKKSFPELVFQETSQEKINDPEIAADEYMQVNYDGLHAVHIQAIKELKEIVSKQQQTIDSLITRVEKLENNK